MNLGTSSSEGQYDELAHAWHHQYLTYQYQPIIDAYQRAMNQGLYGS